MGFSDCGPWLLRWVTEATGRTTEMLDYKTDKEALRHIRNAGNMTTLVSRFCKALSLPMTDSPQRGDIGVLSHPQSLGGQTVGICLGGDKWAIRFRVNGHAKNASISQKPIMAWRVE